MENKCSFLGFRTVVGTLIVLSWLSVCLSLPFYSLVYAQIAKKLDVNAFDDPKAEIKEKSKKHSNFIQVLSKQSNRRGNCILFLRISLIINPNFGALPMFV